MSLRVTTIDGDAAAAVERLPRALTIGAFDGVHLGHQAVIRLVRDLANARGLASAMLTFDRHPAEVVRPEAAPKVLTTLEQKLELLEALDALDEVVVLHFDAARSHETAEHFVETVLADALCARLVVVGSDFHFGNRRHGDVPLLQRMGVELGFEALGLGLVAAPDGSVAASGALPYSSTRVRTLLAHGDVEGAAAILGRPHEIRGVVDGGDVVVSSRICLPAPGRYRSTDGVVDVRADEAETQRRVGAPDSRDGVVRFVSPA